jgi:hypothetical protein
MTTMEPPIFRREPVALRRLASALAFVALAVLGGACTRGQNDSSRAPKAVRDYPGELIDPTQIGSIFSADFVARQVISGSHGAQRFRFEAILQKQRGQITVIGLTPMGTKAFVLQQSATQLTFEQYFPGDAPFPPKYILNDIHRAFFWHAWGAFTPSVGEIDGERRTIWAGESVSEIWREGRLMERRFSRPGDGFCGEIAFHYGDGWRPRDPFPVVEFDNAWFGYRLRIESVDFREI